MMTPVARELAPGQRVALSACYSSLRAPAGERARALAANARGLALAARGDQTDPSQQMNQIAGNLGDADSRLLREPTAAAGNRDATRGARNGAG